MIEPETKFRVFTKAGNKILYKSEGEPAIFVSYMQNGEESTVAVSQGGHLFGEYRGGRPIKAAPDHLYRKVIHSDLPTDVKSVVNKNAANLPEAKTHAKLDLTDGPLEAPI